MVVQGCRALKKYKLSENLAGDSGVQLEEDNIALVQRWCMLTSQVPVNPVREATMKLSLSMADRLVAVSSRVLRTWERKKLVKMIGLGEAGSPTSVTKLRAG